MKLRYVRYDSPKLEIKSYKWASGWASESEVVVEWNSAGTVLLTYARLRSSKDITL